jgi:transmembrane sensor
MKDDRFIELLTSELSGEISPDEQKELQQLLQTNPAYIQFRNLFKAYWFKNSAVEYNNQALFAKIKEAISEQQATENSGESIAGPIPMSGRQPWYLNTWFKAAAVVVVIGSAIFLYQRNKPDPINQATHGGQLLSRSTAKGAQSMILLPDGTRITLNADSRLDYPENFSGSTREVHLTGEAFFDVHKDALHPFIIHAGNMNIKVLGTAFNVKAYPNEKLMETTLIRGQIAVTFKDKRDDPIVMYPSQKLVVNTRPVNTDNARDTVAVRTVKPPVSAPSLTTLTYFKNHDTTVVETSWLQHKLVFKDEDFAGIARKMERWYNTSIRFENEAIKHLSFSGMFEKETTVEEALTFLKLSDGGFDFKKTGSGIIIY